jgi:indolepyruvate ferredoxin oxidoreductase alpha subunit
MTLSYVGVNGGLVLVSCDDPELYSSQNEQDNRHYAKLAKVPMLEPSDSQEAYEFMAYAFELSEEFDTPVLVRTTTRISHSKSIVEVTRSRDSIDRAKFKYNDRKYVMLPANARFRRPFIERRAQIPPSRFQRSPWFL